MTLVLRAPIKVCYMRCAVAHTLLLLPLPLPLPLPFPFPHLSPIENIVMNGLIVRIKQNSRISYIPSVAK